MTILSRLLAPASRPRPGRKSDSRSFQAVAEVSGSLGRYQDINLHFSRKWITIFLAVLVFWSIVAGLYLNITSQTTIAGREIQEMQRDIKVNLRTNADLQTNIAIQLSSESLRQRAVDAGFVQLQNSELEYMVVPGYIPQSGISMAVTKPAVEDDNQLPPEYTESLFSWISRQIEAASLPLAQDQ